MVYHKLNLHQVTSISSLQFRSHQAQRPFSVCSIHIGVDARLRPSTSVYVRRRARRASRDRRRRMV